MKQCTQPLLEIPSWIVDWTGENYSGHSREDAVIPYLWHSVSRVAVEELRNSATSTKTLRENSSSILTSNRNMSSSTERKIVVGVDFGTTFSGVAWAISTGSQPGNVEVIKRWPDNSGGKRTSEKVPTRLRSRWNSAYQWGFLIPRGAPRNEVLEWFKLLSLLPIQHGLCEH